MTSKWLGVACACCLVVGATLLASCSNEGSDAAPLVVGTSLPETVGPDEFDMFVYVQHGASAEQVDDVRRALLSSDVVDGSRLVYLDEQASLDLAEVMLADDPDMLAVMTIENVPSTFEVVPVAGGRADLPALAEDMRELSIVVDAVVSPDRLSLGFDPRLQWTDGVGLIVFVENGATAEEVDVVRQALVASGVVDASRLAYFDAQASLDEATRVFADDPDTLALLNIDNIPSMFKVVPIAGVVDLSPLATQIGNISEVREVVLRPDFL